MTQATSPMRVLIADDEPLCRDTLHSLLAAEPDVEILGSCRNGTEALEQLRQDPPDLVFLDVEMPGLNGFEVLTALDSDHPPMIIFTTAYDSYAIEAFGVHAVDYLLKPFDDERFTQALDRARDLLSSERVVEASQKLASIIQSKGTPQDPSGDDSKSPPAPGPVTTPVTTPRSEPETQLVTEDPAPLDRLTIRREGGIELVQTSSILWVEAADQYVRLHTRKGEVLMRESMGALERSLDPARFQRVHRSAIIALDQIQRLVTQPGGLGKVQLLDETWIPVSRARIAALRRRLG